jgi:DNA repair exonuclease SbcCD ATPase subunit
MGLSQETRADIALLREQLKEVQALKQEIEDAHAVLDEAGITRVWAISKSGEKTLAERVRLLTERQLSARDLAQACKQILKEESSNPDADMLHRRLSREIFVYLGLLDR